MKFPLSLLPCLALLACAQAPVKPPPVVTSVTTLPAILVPGATPDAYYAGRISVSVQGDSPQFVIANFELQGSDQAGQLGLFSPIGGSQLAELGWNAQNAWLKQKDSTQLYASTTELMHAITGAAIPLNAVFDWLAGRPNAQAGWEVNQTELPNGLLRAKRVAPLPVVELKIALES